MPANGRWDLIRLLKVNKTQKINNTRPIVRTRRPDVNVIVFRTSWV